MTDRTEVARFGSLTEAQIAAGYLRNEGFDAEVLDAHHGSVAPFLIFALGWFRVSVPGSEEMAARAALGSVAVTPGEEAPVQPTSPADRLMQVATAVLGALAGVPFVRKRWRRP